MIPSFLILFGAKASKERMIISLMLRVSCRPPAGRRDLFPLDLSRCRRGGGRFLRVWLVLYALAKDSFINSSAQTWFETIVFFLAA